MLMCVTRACATASLSAEVLPGFAADGATTAAVPCSITKGYPNNVYSIKGTFSDGIRPYYGLTWASHRQLWSAQEERWDTCQPRVETDRNGEWKGFIFIRLETAAPTGHLQFRISVLPLSPISDPGPTVSDWYDTQAYSMAPGGGGAWLQGHVYTDAVCSSPASGIIVRAMDAGGAVTGAGISQFSAIPNDGDPLDTGSFRIAVPAGRIASITGRTRANAPAALYTRASGPWIVYAGGAVSVDGYPWGDANGDGALDGRDASLALRMAGGFTVGSAGAHARADVWPASPDGRVSLEDAIQIAARSLK